MRSKTIPGSRTTQRNRLVGRRGQSIAALALAFAAPVPLSAAESQPWIATGELLIAFEGPVEAVSDPARLLGPAALAPGARFERLLVLESLETTAGPAGIEAPATARAWYQWRPPSAAGLTAPGAPSNPWDEAHRRIGEGGGLLELATGAGPAQVVAIEPDVALAQPALERGERDRRRERRSCVSRSAGREATVCSESSFHWPTREIGWHASDAYSQLGSARSEVARRLGAEALGVTVVHLDTGFDDDHVALPARLDRAASLDFTRDGAPASPASDPNSDCTFCNPGHGTGTLSLLAGSELTIRDAAGRPLFEGPLGGIPAADVRCYRISDSVVHLTTGRMVKAFTRAVADRADVLSMSMGGLPSRALADAVNQAYENGVAMFTAAGDFIKRPNFPISSPKSIVYPARFSRVVAVTGATADLKTYAEAPDEHSWRRGKIGSWSLRGSYGPPKAMAHALAGFTPNVPWAVLWDGTPSNLVDLDGAGTSASTPQVAAAAALWLALHRAELGSEWRGWRKSEAVYRALLDTAAADLPADAAKAAYYRKYFGAGLLRARAALDRPPYLAGLTLRPRAKVGFEWLELLTSVALEDPESEQRAELRREMLRTETAQLVAGSIELQELLGDHDLDEPLPDALRARFFSALAAEPAASGTLRAALAARR